MNVKIKISSFNTRRFFFLFWFWIFYDLESHFIAFLNTIRIDLNFYVTQKNSILSKKKIDHF